MERSVSIVTPHFHSGEFSSPGVLRRRDRVQVPARYRRNLRRVMVALETIRAALGGHPVKILSGYRTPEYNRQNKGRASKSQHLYANAADIRVKGVRVRDVYWAIAQLRHDGKIPKGGLAAYPTFVHYDCRGRNVGWRRAP